MALMATQAHDNVPALQTASYIGSESMSLEACLRCVASIRALPETVSHSALQCDCQCWATGV
jgi:hypothetical protein